MATKRARLEDCIAPPSSDSDGELCIEDVHELGTSLGLDNQIADYAVGLKNGDMMAVIDLLMKVSVSVPIVIKLF